ncbi:MAG: ribosome maturation factor RimM [Bacteroidales bacterium]|jgi:16S rRNA processing protein RimM|nr:ribosome maturation factor RimM [Bacteroidales bacterium]
MYNFETDKGEYFQLGRVIKVHGYRGELVVLLETDKPEDYAKLETIFLNIDDSLVPFWIRSIRINDNLAIISLDDITEKESAIRLLKKEVFLPIQELHELEGNDFYFHEIIGFSVVDKKYGDIGMVEDILERPEQELIRILKDNKEILIPLTDDMIRKVDRKKKTLHIITPDGLIDLYLE